MDREFRLGGRDFRLSKLDPLKQFHIARRVAPIMSDLMPAFQEITKAGPLTEDAIETMPEDEKFALVGKVAKPVMDGLSKLSDEDSEFVLRNLLSAVAIKQQAGNWAAVATPQMIMMQDLELPVLMQIAGRGFLYNLSGFISAQPQTSGPVVRA